MSADTDADEQARQSLTFPSDAIETTLEQLPVNTLTDEQRAYARECCSLLDTHQYASGRSPSGLAAASIYLAALVRQDPGHHSYPKQLSQDEVAEYCDVSPLTIRSHYRRILEIKKDSEDDHDQEHDRLTIGDSE